MLAKDILKEVRYKLSDTSKERWTDERLLSLLNQGMKDIAKNTILFVENKIYQVSNLVVDIDLSSISTKILRAEYLDEPLPFYSFEEMDEKDSKWQLVTGDTVQAIIYDKQKNSVLKQYPIVSNVYNPHVIVNQPYGVITDISYSDVQPVLANTYGDIAEIPATALIKFYYIRKHSKVVDINETLYIDDLIEQPLIHYITGHAFNDNQDTQSLGQGKMELQMYYNSVNEYSIQKSYLFVKSDNNVRYRPLG